MAVGTAELYGAAVRQKRSGIPIPAGRHDRGARFGTETNAKVKAFYDMWSERTSAGGRRNAFVLVAESGGVHFAGWLRCLLSFAQPQAFPVSLKICRRSLQAVLPCTNVHGAIGPGPVNLPNAARSFAKI
jgi:hypothetical protein